MFVETVDRADESGACGGCAGDVPSGAGNGALAVADGAAAPSNPPVSMVNTVTVTVGNGELPKLASVFAPIMHMNEPPRRRAIIGDAPIL
jgi:hypothetical protein